MPWAVAVARINQERVADTNLKDQGFRTYFPKYLERRVQRGRRVMHERFLFGRYFFVWFERQWETITNTRGVAKVVMQNEKPSLAKDEVVAKIKAKEVDGFIEVEEPKRFRHGQKVLVLSGPFENSFGVWQGMRGTDRELVLLGLLGAQRPVQIHTGALTACV